MYKVKLMNKISSVGLDYFNEDYEYGETLENEDAILLRSASLHEYEFTKMLKQLRELVRGSITFLLKNVQKKELLFLIHRGQMRMR